MKELHFPEEKKTLCKRDTKVFGHIHTNTYTQPHMQLNNPNET